MTTCEHVERTHALADGELTGAIADDARDHLAGCETCQNEFSDALQLDAAVTEAPSNIVSIAWYRQRKVQLASAALAAAAGVAIYVAVSRPKPPQEDHPQIAAIALAPNRGVEARLAWSDAQAYRPYDVPRGDAPHENVPLSVLGDVEKRGDLHGVAVLAMLDGDRKQAASYFERAGNGADVQLDRAALALGDGDPAKALGLVDGVLEKDAANPVALWNRALALRDLGLPRAAAAAFRDVAKRNEPGWAAEATARAKALDAGVDAERDLTIRVFGAAGQLAKDGTGLSIDDAKKLPGFSRLLFYDALRSAPTAERIAKLRPLAEAIDQATHSGDLVAAIERAKPRGALADTYAEIITKQAAGDWDHLPARAPYLAALRAAHADDLLIGALIKLAPDGTVAKSELGEFARLTAASPDPWMRLLGIQQRADVAIADGDLLGAITTLSEARATCAGPSPNYRCINIERLLAHTYVSWQRMPEAHALLVDAWSRARSDSDWTSQMTLLSEFAALANAADDATGGGLSLARAYTTELRLRGPDEARRSVDANSLCDNDAWGRNIVATILINQLQTDAAKHELELAPRCPASSPVIAANRLFARAHIVRAGNDVAEIDALRADVDKLRATPDLSPGLRAYLDHIEGRAVIDRDPVAGEALLRRAIAAAQAEPSDPEAVKVSAWSYSVMATSEGKRNDGTTALKTLAGELGVTVPATCAVGIAAEGRDVVAITRDKVGAIAVHVSPRASTAAVPPTDLAPSLAGCDHVDVIARPPFHGVARLLPDDIAWSYLSARKRPVGPASDRRLVVSDVEPPASLELPRLAAWTTPTTDALAGPNATPTRVLAALGDVGEVTIHAHGLVDQLDASFLALSPDATGHYALTTRDVRAATFTTSPLVILAACRASHAAPVLHQPWSLPTAFVFAGARAVVASTSPIPDADAGTFFDDFTRRVRAGQPAAIALRDSRIAWLHQGRGDWVRDLIVFD